MRVDLSSYLKRLDYRGPLDVSSETLRQLHRAHMVSVPFENLDIHLGRPIVLEQERLLDKIVVQHRGGFCYELNGGFAWLLRSLGFEVQLLSAGVARADGGFDPPFDHMALLVETEQRWLADVGFGDSFIEPLPLVENVGSTQDGDSYRLVRTGDFPDLFPGEETMILQRLKQSGAWEPQFLFSLRPYGLSDFAQMCEYHQTSPASTFTRKRTCSLATVQGRVTLSGLRLIETVGETRSENEVLDPDQYRNLLLTRFGVELSHGDVARLMRAEAHSAVRSNLSPLEKS